MKKMLDDARDTPASAILWGAMSRFFFLRDDEGNFALDPNEELNLVSFITIHPVVFSPSLYRW